MLHTEKEAMTKICPIRDKDVCHSFCLGSACMWWEEIHSKITREDHSGGNAAMHTAIMHIHKNHGGKLAEIKREGPPGSTGVFIIEARGRCGACHK